MPKCSTCGKEYPEDSYCKDCNFKVKAQIIDINDEEKEFEIDAEILIRIIKENWIIFALLLLFIIFYIYHLKQIDACNAFWFDKIPKPLNNIYT